LVNGFAVSIHHDASDAPFFPVSFIFDERRGRMVNRWFCLVTLVCAHQFRVNSPLKNIS